MGGEVALGHRESLRWNTVSSFILTPSWSSGGRGGTVGGMEGRREGEIKEKDPDRKWGKKTISQNQAKLFKVFITAACS